MTRTHLVLTPRDGLSLKDPRSYDIAGGLPATGLPWPTPSTVAGAARAAIGIGRGLPTRHGEGKDEWLRLLDEVTIAGPLAVVRTLGDRWEPLWPTPQDALRLPPLTEPRDPADPTARTVWLNPRPKAEHARVRGLWLGDEPEIQATESLWLAPRPTEKGKPLEARRWWSQEEFNLWLRSPQQREEHSPISLPELRNDVRLAIDHESGAAKDQHLFGQPTQEVLFRHKGSLKELGIALQVDCSTPPPPSWLKAPWRLGGETRFAQPHEVPNPYKEDLARTWRPSRFLRLCLITPARFFSGWRPDWLTPVQSPEGKWRFEGPLPSTRKRVALRAAFVDRPQWISGWDLVAKGPKPSSRCVRPGAVYYFESLDAELSADDVRSLWLSSVQAQDDDARRNGFGLVVPGAWPQTT